MALPHVDHHRERGGTVTPPYLCGSPDHLKPDGFCNDPAPTAFIVHVFPELSSEAVRVDSVLLLCDRHRDAMLNA